ncbi:MAG: helix-turn-helix domain-containing protein [Candidatus Nanopelagicales bacterium]
MTTVAPDPAVEAVADNESRLRSEVSDLRGLLALSLLMTARRHEEEIVHVAVTALPALVAVRPLGVHLVDGERTTWLAAAGACSQPSGRSEAAAQIRRLPADDGPLHLKGEPWCWAIPLRSLGDLMGHLLVAADAEPSPNELLLVRSLAQQTGISLANARLHARNIAANEQLAQTVATLRHKTEIHDRLTQASLGDDGVQGVVEALHQLTGLTATAETRGGDLLAWAGGDQPPRSWGGSPERRDQTLQRALRAGHPIRADGRLLVVARPRPDVVGVLSLLDPEKTTGEQEIVALEHASMVLAVELARQHGLAETELRLGRDLVADLLTGTGDEAYQRAQALGHDLRRPHRVVVASPGRRATAADPLLLQVREALAAGLRMPGEPPVLLVQKDATVVALATDTALADDALLASLAESLGAECRIGVGGWASAREDYPRSFREASQALRLGRHMAHADAVLRYDDLGVFRLLSENADPAGLDVFVSDQLGALVAYDAERGTDLVETLARYLDTGGSYDATAAALMIGRTTVRYRIRRISALAGHDLRDPETRFQLQLATRAWATRQAASTD